MGKVTDATKARRKPDRGKGRAPSTTHRGRAGEDIAVLHLKREGYTVLERNVRCAGAEIDIVAREGDLLCFVEVRRRTRRGDALESVDARKQARIARAALAYLQRLSPTPRCRFDVVAVSHGRAHLVRAAFEAAP